MNEYTGVEEVTPVPEEMGICVGVGEGGDNFKLFGKLPCNKYFWCDFLNGRYLTHSYSCAGQI